MEVLGSKITKEVNSTPKPQNIFWNKIREQGAGGRERGKKRRRGEKGKEGERWEKHHPFKSTFLSTYTCQAVFQIVRKLKAVIVGPESFIRWLHDLAEIVPIIYF